MKTSNILLLAVVAVAFTACQDRDTKKKIAEIEARITQLEQGKAATDPSPMNVSPQTAPVQNPNPAPAADQKPEGPLPEIAFEKTEHDFGVIKEGAKVSYTYSFKNTGKAPLIIQDAKPSCGCTAPDWSRNPIPVGGTGFVKAEFDSKGKPGAQMKTITVTANTWPTTTTLRFKASVSGN